jgi:hypothetical protein
MKKSNLIYSVNKPKVRHKGYSLLLEEAPAGNEVNWGDSLIGRLINSTIRKMKIGYNQTKVKDLVTAFERELDGLLAASLQGEAKNKFTLIKIKSYFSELQNICYSDNTDDQKLKDLLDANRNLFDASKPDGGKWKQIIKGGFLFDVYNDLENTFGPASSPTRNDEEEAEFRKVGVSKADLMDKISDFIDDMRKLTSTSTASSVASVGYRTFATNFGNVSNQFSTINANFTYQYQETLINEDVLKFGDFVFEATGEKIDTGKEVTEPEGNKKVQKIEKGKEYTNKNGKLKPYTGSDTVKDKSGKPLQVPQQKSTTPQQAGNTASVAPKDTLGATPELRIKKLKELALKVKDIEDLSDQPDAWGKDVNAFLNCLLSLTNDDVKYFMEKNPNFKLEIDDKKFDILAGIEYFVGRPEFEKFKKKFNIQGIRAKDSNTQVMKNSTYTKDQKIAEFKKRKQLRELALKKNPTSEKHKKSLAEIDKFLKELGATTNESVINFKNFLILESIQDGSVEKIFEEFKKSLPEELFSVTQREVDEFQKLSGPGQQKLLLNLSVNPDPIIRIIRIFQRAHDLYFTGTIPSGRSGGKVSNKTFLEYIPLGKDYRGTQETPGYGPYAVKKIYDSWRDNVLRVMENQKYRKIFANINFVVPGSEDTFNQKQESLVLKLKDYKKIFEATSETEDDKKKKSHGQILLDFINDMLDKETAADFDAARRKLVRKYFGQFGVDEKAGDTGIRSRPNPPTKIPSNMTKDSLTWIGETDTTFKCEDINIGKYGGEIYFIPISPEEDSICLLALKKISDKRWLVKFQFRSDETFEDQITRQGLYSGKNWEKKYKMGTGRAPDKLYYGIIREKKTQPGEKINMVYSEFQGNKYSEPEYKEFTIETLTSGGNTIVSSKLYSTDSGGNSNSVKYNYQGKNPVTLKLIRTEKSSEEENLKVKNTSGSYNRKELLEALKKKADDVGGF